MPLDANPSTMRAIWKGAITFGLVNIPISLLPAVRREELKFRLLRRKDLSPVSYKRVAAADGREVPWEDIVKGYEYDKDKFVVLKDEDFARVDIEATQTVDIMHFVRLDEVNPLLFYKPYYLEASRGGDKAYVLLRDALSKSGKIAIAKVVIRTRQHLAAVKPQKDALPRRNPRRGRIQGSRGKSECQAGDDDGAPAHREHEQAMGSIRLQGRLPRCRRGDD